MENLSGHGDFFEVPSEVKGWNWGAFWLTWIWGFNNDVLISFLGLIPVVNIFMSFYLGFKGSELSWKYKRWENPQQFYNAQKKWTIAGWITMVIIITPLLLLMKDQYQVFSQGRYIKEEVRTMISQDTEALEFVGQDFEIAEYRRDSMFYFNNKTHSIVTESEENKCWITVRLNEDDSVKEILITYYFVLTENVEIIVRNE